jgi:hypothetical protein
MTKRQVTQSNSVEQKIEEVCVLAPAETVNDVPGSDADWLLNLMQVKSSWSNICQTLGVPCGFEIPTDSLRKSINNLNADVLVQAISIFGFLPATREALVCAARLSPYNFMTGAFFLHMIPAARCWEATPFGVEKSWDYEDSHYRALAKILFDKPLSVSGYWLEQYESNTHHFFDVKAFSEQAKKLKLNTNSMVIFIRAWILRLCEESYGALPENENLDFYAALRNGITEKSADNTLYGVELSDLLTKQYDESSVKTPFCYFFIPFLKSSAGSFLGKDIFLSALLGKNDCEGVVALSQWVWMRHILSMAPPRLIVETALQFKEWEIPGLQDYLEKDREPGMQANEAGRQVPYKIMQLPTPKERYNEVRSKAVQTYVKLCSPSILTEMEDLDARFPNFKEVTAYIRKKLLFATKLSKPFHTPPILLKGPSGVGKTFYLQNLKEVLSLPVLSIHATQITCGSALAGLQSTWGTGQAGSLGRHLADTKVANSLVIFDELSQLKAVTSSSGLDPLAVLLQALEPNESKTFRDAYTEQEIDLSKFSWFFTANHLNNLDSFLLTRLTVFSIEPVKTYKSRTLIDDLVRQITESLDLPEGMIQPLDDLCCRQILDHLNRGGNLRKLRLLLEDAVTEVFEDQETTVDTHVTISSAWLRKHL